MTLPIIDTHIHLFDPTRPQGVPWPPKDDKVLYQPALPSRFRKLTDGFGVVGAIEVECSPWLEDNQWVLDVAANEPVIVGTVGDLDPAAPEFRRELDRFHRNPLFRGIRYGNLWGRDMSRELSNPAFIAGMKALADADLELDTANPDPALIAAVVRLTDQVPNLRVVIDHLPQMNPPSDSQSLSTLEANLKELGQRPQVYVKLSEILRRVDGTVPEALPFYQPRLDELWGIFGEDRLMYGSDWPNCDHWGTYAEVLSLARGYLAEKSDEAAEKFFWKNSLAAYHWVRRDKSQPVLANA